MLTWGLVVLLLAMAGRSAYGIYIASSIANLRRGMDSNFDEAVFAAITLSWFIACAACLAAIPAMIHHWRSRWLLVAVPFVLEGLRAPVAELLFGTL